MGIIIRNAYGEPIEHNIKVPYNVLNPTFDYKPRTTKPVRLEVEVIEVLNQMKEEYEYRSINSVIAKLLGLPVKEEYVEPHVELYG